MLRMTAVHTSPDTALEHEHRRRLLIAMAAVTSDKSFASATIADLVREAGVSKRSFYEHFSSKDDCFLALYRAVCGSALRTLREAVMPDKPWQAQLEHALDAYFAQLAGGPRLLKTLFVEIHHLGEAGAQARREVMQALADFMLATVNRPVEGSAALLKPTLAMAAVGGINELVLQAIENGQAAELRRLTPTACELVRLFAHADAR
jgi:AcrR family transcriptional regulator